MLDHRNVSIVGSVRWIVVDDFVMVHSVELEKEFEICSLKSMMIVWYTVMKFEENSNEIIIEKTGFFNGSNQWI